MKLELNFDELGHTSEENDANRVKEAVGKLVGKIRQMVDTADDADELVAHLTQIGELAKNGRRELREHRMPVAELGSGSTGDSTELSEAEMAIVQDLRESTEGDLTKLPGALQKLHDTIANLEEKLQNKTTELESARNASGSLDLQHEATVADLNTNITRLETELRDANRQLQVEKTRANASPHAVAVAKLFKDKGKLVRTTRGGKVFGLSESDLSGMSTEQLEQLGLKK